MSIISQETWNKFTEEEKERVCKYYLDVKDTVASASVAFSALFGKENLQYKPKIKTWEDIEEGYPKEMEYKDSLWRSIFTYVDSDKLKLKLVATYKIAKLIEIGYGGMVTEEEMKDTSIDIYNIYPDEKKQFIIGCLNTRLYDFICFHTKQQAEEFMSYPENRTLLKQYYMI